MARNAGSSRARTPAALTDDKKRSAVIRLRQRADEIDKLAAKKFSEDNAEVKTLSALLDNTLADIFGPESLEYSALRDCTELDATEYDYRPRPDGGVTAFASPLRILKGIEEGCLRAVIALRAKADALEEGLTPLANSSAVPPRHPATNEIFVVHGRDEQAKNLVVLVLTRAGLLPIVLHEQPNRGATIIEKFERHGSSAGFAVAILTPDDLGGLDASSLHARARQNVIGEMFWFAGKLGRERVCALKKGDLEMPSDFAGVGWVNMDEAGVWKAELCKELQGAGYPINWSSALA